VNVDFVRTKKFFELLVERGLRKKSEPYLNLVQNLALEGGVYNQGLVIRKIELLIKECTSNEYLKAMTLRKRQLEKRISISKEEVLKDPKIAVVNEYSSSSFSSSLNKF
jgi:hypothetical protein